MGLPNNTRNRTLDRYFLSITDCFLSTVGWLDLAELG